MKKLEDLIAERKKLYSELCMYIVQKESKIKDIEKKIKKIGEKYDN